MNFIWKNRKTEKKDELEAKFNILNETVRYGQQLSKTGYWLYEIGTGKVSWSEEVYNILGCGTNSLDESFECFLPYIHADDLEMVREARRLVTAAEEYDIEYRIITAGEEIKYVREKTKVIPGESNAPAKVAGIIQDITEQKLRENSLREIGDNLIKLQKVAGVGSWKYDAVKNELYCTDELLSIYGFDRTEVASYEDAVRLIHPEDQGKVQNAMDWLMLGRSCSAELRIISKDGTVKHVEGNAEPIFNEDGEVTGVFGTAQDITEKKILLESLKKSYKSLIEAERIARMGSWEIDLVNRKVVFCSGEVLKMYGIPKEQTDISIELLKSYIHPDDRHILQDIYTDLPAKQPLHFEVRVVRPDGSVLYVDNFMEIIFDEDGKPVCMRGTSQDVTDKKELQKKAERAQKEIMHLSTHDQLTGLPNNIDFDSRVDMLSEDALKKNTGFAVIMLDIDSLRYVKNTLGYKAAEEYITQIALKLKMYCGKTDYLCHYSYNRFIIILEGFRTTDEYDAFIKGIFTLFSEPLRVDRYELDTEISIGVSFFSKDEPKTEQLVRRAETAIFLAKSDGKNRHRYYSPDLDIPSYKYFTLRNDLRKSIESNQLKFYYQPIVSLGTNTIIAAEALLRWEHPEWGIVSPAEFITMAEETGYIITIGQWLIREVCSSYKQWLDRRLPPVKIAINFSSMQFFETSFVRKIRDTIEEFGLDPGFLIMETTESVLMEKSDKVTVDIRQLQSIGIQIALDNFGTGYSSLTGLNAFNIDILKLDGLLIKDINKNETSTVITRHIVRMAQELKIKLVAERIETWDQLAFLRDIKCYAGQGYIYSRPVPPKEFERLLAKKICTPEAPQGAPVHGERRKFFRIKFLRILEANLTILEIKGKKVNVGNTKVLIKNIGPGGLCFITNFRLPVDDKIIMQFKTQLIGEEITVYGCIVWSRDIENGLFEYGVKFTFDENKRTELVKVLNQVQIRMRNDSTFADGSFVSGSPYAYFNS